MTRQELTDKFFELKKQKEVLEDEAVSKQKEIDAIEERLIGTMVNENIKQFKDLTHGTISIREYSSAKIADKLECIAWLKSNNLSDIVTETVNSATLGAMIRKDSLEIPGVEFNSKLKISARKG